MFFLQTINSWRTGLFCDDSPAHLSLLSIFDIEAFRLINCMINMNYIMLIYLHDAYKVAIT